MTALERQNFAVSWRFLDFNVKIQSREEHPQITPITDLRRSVDPTLRRLYENSEIPPAEVGGWFQIQPTKRRAATIYESHQRKLVDGSDPTCSRLRPMKLRSPLYTLGPALGGIPKFSDSLARWNAVCYDLQALSWLEISISYGNNS